MVALEDMAEKEEEKKKKRRRKERMKKKEVKEGRRRWSSSNLSNGEMFQASVFLLLLPPSFSLFQFAAPAKTMKSIGVITALCVLLACVAANGEKRLVKTYEEGEGVWLTQEEVDVLVKAGQ